MADADRVIITLQDGQRLTASQLLEPRKKRVKAGLAARKPFEAQWIENMAAAAGQQWLRVIDRGGRQLVDIREELERQNRSTLEADVLTQNLWTALGILYQDDFRPELLAYQPDVESDMYADALNRTFGWGWDEEWRGDVAIFDLLLTLGTLGSGAIQPRYDRTKGAYLGQVPHVGGKDFTHRSLDDDGQPVEKTYRAGQPILDKPAATAYVGDRRQYGEDPGLRPLREGAVTWPVLTPWNLIPPAGLENPDDFAYEDIVRPVSVDQLKDIYGDRAADVREDDIEAMSVLGIRDLSPQAGQAGGSGPKLEGHTLLYTHYDRPCGKYPNGLTVVRAGDVVLDVKQSLPCTKGPHGPRTGITYFRYWKVKGRFWGRALIEPGIGPQRILNKRLSQEDEIVDRSTPKVYANEGDIIDPSGHIMEVIALKPGSQPPKIDPGMGPGAWFKESREAMERYIETGMGLHGQSVGQEAPAGTPFAAMAQQAANDQTKLGPIVGEIKLGVADVCRDTIEKMREWPDGKSLLIDGEDKSLENLVFKREMLPAQYKVHPAKGGMPRSQGAELQKITDIWQAALAAQVVATDAEGWLSWYQRSLDAGKAQELPEMNGRQQQQHKAALENAVMMHSFQVVPVAPFDDAQIHIPVHDQQQAKLAQAAMLGDPDAEHLQQVIEAHKQQHLVMAQQVQGPGAPAPTLPPELSSSPPLPGAMTSGGM